jgi:hypothetical protein
MFFAYMLSKYYSGWTLSIFFLSGLIQGCEGLRLLFMDWLELDFKQVALEWNRIVIDAYS